MPTEFEYAVSRLDQLEVAYRRLRRRARWLTILVAAQGVLLLYLLLPVGRLGVPKYLEASHFVLVDDDGRVRGKLQMDEGPRLQLLTEMGQERATLWVNHDGGASLILLDNRPGGGRSAMVFASDEESGVELMDHRAARAGFRLSDLQPGLQKVDEPPPAKPNP